jgi:uncharacterized protein
MIRRHPVTCFFVFACVFCWAGIFPFGLSKAGVLPWKTPGEVPLVAQYGPSLAAVLMTGLVDGRGGVQGLLGRTLRWRANVRWYAFVVLVTPAMVLAALELCRAFAGAPIQWSALRDWAPGYAARFQGLMPSIGPLSRLIAFMQKSPAHTAVALIPLAICNGGLSEELGWRGYAFPKLEARWGALRASVVVGVMWGIWHLGPWELLFVDDLRTALRENAEHVLLYLAACVPLSVLFSCVYKNTGQSLLLVIVFHAAENLAIGTAVQSWDDFPYPTYLMVLWAVAATMVLVFGPHLVRLSR